MARPLRIEYPGAFYHVINRGNAGQPIFKSKKDREKFIEYLALMVERFRISLHCYCLMSNHYHLLIGAHPQIVDFRVHQEVKNYSRSSSQSNFVLHRIKLQKIFNTGIIKAHLYRLKLKQARYCSRHVAGLALALAMVSKLAATMDDQT